MQWGSDQTNRYYTMNDVVCAVGGLSDGAKWLKLQLAGCGIAIQATPRSSDSLLNFIPVQPEQRVVQRINGTGLEPAWEL